LPLELRLANRSSRAQSIQPFASCVCLDEKDADSSLAEAEAIRLARLEKQREPVDLVNVAA
jgi:hypothetical protein